MPLVWEKLSQLPSKFPLRNTGPSEVWHYTSPTCVEQTQLPPAEAAVPWTLRECSHSFIPSSILSINIYQGHTICSLMFQVLGIQQVENRPKKEPLPCGVSVLMVWSRAGMRWSKWGARVQDLWRHPLSGSCTAWPWLEDRAHPDLVVTRGTWTLPPELSVFCLGWAPRTSILPGFSRWFHAHRDWEPLSPKPTPRYL